MGCRNLVKPTRENRRTNAPRAPGPLPTSQRTLEPVSEPANPPNQQPLAVVRRRSPAQIDRVIRAIRKRVYRPVRSPVRVLFSPPPTEESRQEIAASVAKLAQRIHERSKREFMSKWNFDIDEEKPVPGPYQWEETR